jgi:hypothetical protein
MHPAIEHEPVGKDGAQMLGFGGCGLVHGQADMRWANRTGKQADTFLKKSIQKTFDSQGRV